jgi:putative addiction module killer protein
MNETSYCLEYYQRENGSVPFRDWLHELRDSYGVERIRARLARVRAGNFGNIRILGNGVCELKVDHGPGYRLYYAMSGTTVVLLLVGGDKSTQKRDIDTARQYWRAYQEG